MDYQRQDVLQGIRIGLTRSLTALDRGLDGIRLGRREIDQLSVTAAGHIEPVLKEWPQDLHPRFVGLFAELVAVAIAARLVNREPDLSRDQTTAFLALCADFFNSFKHK